MISNQEIYWKVNDQHFRILPTDYESITNTLEGRPHIWHGVAKDGTTGIFSTNKIVSGSKVSYSTSKVTD